MMFAMHHAYEIFVCAAGEFVVVPREADGVGGSVQSKKYFALFSATHNPCCEGVMFNSKLAFSEQSPGPLSAL
jgi:hypothetical protein